MTWQQWVLAGFFFLNYVLAIQGSAKSDKSTGTIVATNFTLLILTIGLIGLVVSL